MNGVIPGILTCAAVGWSMLVARSIIVVLLAAAVAGGWLLFAPAGAGPSGERSSASELQVTVADPFEAPLLARYRTYHAALRARDHAALAELAAADDSYLAFRSALTLARSIDLSPAEQLPFYARAAELRLTDPLARLETREFHLEAARTAETAGDLGAALMYYREALPATAAITALKRLEDDPYRLANAFFAERQYQNALDALDGRAAPSLEAPGWRALGEHAKALEAYERWLAEQPDNAEALLGRAWSHFYLANNELADSLFAELPGSNALYGRALLANRAGDVTRAVELMAQSGESAHLWLATGWLEARERYSEAIPLYLRLAEGTSVYADESAFRAFVLAQALADEELTAQARSAIRPDSFFALALGGSLLLPDSTDVPAVESEVVELALALARVNDEDAAVGELVFALRKAPETAEIVLLAETLQMLGEFRQSQVAAQRLVSAGSMDLRVWRLAWPKAYPQEVQRAAESFGVEPELIWAIMRQESAFYPFAVSTSNAQGLMQVVPTTWDWLAELQKEAPQDSFDPATNIRYGAFYLRWLLNYLDDDLELVVASYNRGQGYIKRLFEGDVVAGDKVELYREIDALETRNYLQRVMLNYHIYHGLEQGGGEQPALVAPLARLAAGN
jgi:soluble lytic murein transglycosylase